MKTDIKKRAYKYSKALTSTPITEQGDLLITKSNGKFKKILPEDVKSDGVTYKLTKELYNDLIVEHQALLDTVKGASHYLTAVLIENGYQTSNIELKALISDINKLKIIKPNEQYTHYDINYSGYVIGSSDYGSILLSGDKPVDYDKGYWKITDGKWELDEIKYNQFWGI